MTGFVEGADRWVAGLLAWELKGVALLALVTVAVLTLRRGSAAGRHWVWLLGVVGLLVLPLVQAATPRWAAPVPSWVMLAGPEETVPVAGVARAATDTRARVPVVRADAPRPGGAVSGPWSEKPAPDASQTSPSPSAHASAADPRAEPGAGPGTEPASGADAAASAVFSIPAAAVLLGVWALGACALLVGVVLSLVATWRLEARTPAFPPGKVRTLTDVLVPRLGIRRRVRLLRGAPDAMPVSWGWVRPVVLLPADAEGWPRNRLAAVLLHELAHVRRADCLAQMLAEVAVALHWVNPLAWLAAARMRVEREYACDDLVLRAGARASDYADELLALARSFRPERATARAAVAMARPGSLAGRMRAVLDATRRRTLRPVRAAVAGLAAALLVVGLGALAPAPRPTATSDTSAASDRTAPEPEPVGGAASVAAAAAADARPAAARNVLPATPAPQATSCGTEPDGWRNVSTQSNDDRTRLEWSKPGCEVDVRLQGDIEFTADFRDVAGLDRDARLRIEETDEGTRRMLEITAGPGGRPEYAYEVDREERPFDAAARAWYDGLLLQVFRRTGHLAEERVAALLREGGVPAVLRELDELHSDHAFASYTEALLGQAAELSDTQALDVVGRARARVDSDHYLAGILESFAAGHLDSDVMVDEYLAASEAIESDHYRAGVLEIALGRGGLTVAQVGATLESASGIESDHYLAEVLAGVAERYSLEPSLRQVYLRAVSSIESDHYRAEVLGGLLERNDLTAAELAVVLDAAGGIASDSYTAGVLAKVADRDLSSDALRGAYLRVAAGIESDHYRAASLGDLLDRGDDLTDAQVVEIVRAATGIESDHYKAEVLGRVAREHSIEGATREALIEALNTIESDHYRGQVAELVLRR